VTYVGTIAEHKGVHVLIEALNGIEDPRVHCRIWGDLTAFIEYSDRLRALIQNPHTHLMGPFPPDRIADVLAQTDLLVIPSLWFENSPLTIHEAALAEIPVLCSDRGGLAEYVTDGVTGLHFRLGDAQDLRSKILRFLDIPGPLPHFNPQALRIKSIAEDARDMESRYLRLLERSGALAGV
jgi:glycosyltransferase involved in cell wall biosynthesis